MASCTARARRPAGTARCTADARILREGGGGEQEEQQQARERHAASLAKRCLPRSARATAAFTFSSRCASEPVPGMGSMTGDLASSQAMATWAGVALIFPGTCYKLALSARRHRAPSGNHGRKAMPSRSHCLQHRLGAAVAEVVLVLHRDDLRHLARALELLHVEVRDADVADLSRASARRRSGRASPPAAPSDRARAAGRGRCARPSAASGCPRSPA